MLLSSIQLVLQIQIYLAGDFTATM